MNYTRSCRSGARNGTGGQRNEAKEMPEMREYISHKGKGIRNRDTETASPLWTASRGDVRKLRILRTDRESVEQEEAQ